MYDEGLGDFTLVNYANTLAGVNFTAKNSGKFTPPFSFTCIRDQTIKPRIGTYPGQE